MDDLRFVGSDGEYLELESKDGVKYRLLLDEGLRRTIRTSSTGKAQDATISPREIQLEVRSGKTIDEIVKRTGADFEYVEKFAAPVLDELAHVVSSALSVRITIAGDRYNESVQVEFGEIISGRLHASGASSETWAARRTEVGSWLVSCEFTIAGEAARASWNFDPHRLALSPENEMAVQLSSQNSLTESAQPKLRPVPAAVAQANTEAIKLPTSEALASSNGPERAQPSPAPGEPVAATNLTEDLGDTSELNEVIPFGRQHSKEPQLSPQAADEADTSDALAEPSLTATADLLDALRQKRLERESESDASSSTSLEPHPATVPLRSIPVEIAEPEIDADEDPTADASDQLSESEAEASQESPQGTGFTQEVEPVSPKQTLSYKKGRTGIPSWDEIVFGGKPEDDSSKQ